jgi:hypothetical protein
MVNRLEVLADALGKLNGIHDPESTAYRNRNPGLLISFSLRKNADAKNVRMFQHLRDGYEALLADLRIKIRGKSRARGKDGAKLTPESPISDLLIAYGHKNHMPADYVVSFVRRALQDQSIRMSTPLSFFME